MKKKRKNSNYKINFEAEMQAKKSKGNRFLITFICIFMAIIIIAGAAVGIISGIKSANTAMKYNGATLSKEEASFFASYYKNQFIQDLTKSGVKAADTQEFWSSASSDGENYGELLERNTKEYLMKIVVGNYVFDKYSRLSGSDREKIKLSAEDILTYQASGNEEIFDSETSKYGFSYSDFLEITKKLYKARMALVAVFGTDGSKVANDLDLCKTYYSEYSKVKLMFIRADKDFKLDENGNRIVEDGYDIMIDLTDEQKAEREVDIAAIREAILGLENNGALQINQTMFENYLEKYPTGDKDKDKNGFFFHENSYFTKEFKTEFPEVTESALSMESGSFKELSTSVGVCFIYKMPIDAEDSSYLDTKNACFQDFFANLATESFDAMVSLMLEDVEVKDLYNDIDVIAIPYNTTFIPRF